MKRRTLALALAFGMAATTGALAADEAWKNEQQKLSYALGLDLGDYLKTLDDPVDIEALSDGIRDAYTGGQRRLSAEESKAVRAAFAKRQQQKRLDEAAQKAKDNKAAALAFLEKNGKKQGVTTTASGLQYEVLARGKGTRHPTAKDTVRVHYRGTLLDGTEFDSSYKRGEPVSFRLDQVIPGWTEGVQLMTVGDKYRFYLPPELAYGDQGAAPVIPPGSLLIFEVELLAINP